MNCNKCGKWAAAHATLPGQSKDHLCMCPPQRQWVGLDDKERREAMNTVTYSQLAMTMAEWVYEVQKATEAKLKAKNERLEKNT